MRRGLDPVYNGQWNRRQRSWKRKKRRKICVGIHTEGHLHRTHATIRELQVQKVRQGWLSGCAQTQRFKCKKMMIAAAPILQR
mmetsp:Transcript_23841/g.52076  ORF Transcript_23841/g.52076 Transcript_23841/m.52076 type:complete len:83 (+) Transcript_23841:511-759(+)